MVTTRGGKRFSVGGFTIRAGVVEIDFLADPERLDRIDLERLLDGDPEAANDL